MESLAVLEIVIPDHNVGIRGDLACPAHAGGLVIFAHGSDSSRNNPRERFLAGQLQQAGLATLLLDLSSAPKAKNEQPRDDIDLLADRLRVACDWATSCPLTCELPLGLFGASKGAAVALEAAGSEQSRVKAIVCLAGRPDLTAQDALTHVHAPTLLIVGRRDVELLQLNRVAAEQLRCSHRVAVVPDASHLCTEPGALERVASHASHWFRRHLTQTSHRPPIAEEACVE